ncbi:precorrin-6A reductase [uncultured Ruminococcus sp.]|jgi:precorrin-6Y C5,15-methyltransferase (decarboxylating)/precorrin-6A/cobalt-precorrin-6A reductase|uniref:precorrin-6A reductase n=1 Tax=uncultured Ruminococcus sp. TaxID=165186 RepID=UPI0025E52F24|nr:precorrin-6A reductase [uncultured Ruminococcus sp.]
MCRILIFGGTTEGREIAEYCAEKGIAATVSVATEYGAELLPKSDRIKKLVGRLDAGGIRRLITELECSAVIDATHPYAEEVTKNIKAACTGLEVAYYRLIRTQEELSDCIKAESMDELVKILNSSDKKVLSTLGSKELPKLAEVRSFSERIWIRALPVEDVRKSCIELGYSGDRLILEKGPFTVEQNIAHIRKSGAELIVTKESGAVGGFPEKLKAAEICGVKVIVLTRHAENGLTADEIKKIIDEMR